MANLTEHLTFKQMLIPKERYGVKAPYSMSPEGITIHETDNNASAYNEIYYMGFNPSNYNGQVSFHLAVDEVEAIQGVPFDRNTWNAGDGAHGRGNRKTIAIEICRNYRTDNLTNYYKARTNAEILTGWLLYTYGWNESNLFMHKDWSGKNCPRNILKDNYWTTFKANAMKYKAIFAGQDVPVPNPKPTPPAQGDPKGTYTEKGRFKNTVGDIIYTRAGQPSTNAKSNGNIAVNGTFDYDRVYVGNGYVWIGNGKTWVPTGAAKNGKRDGKTWGTFGAQTPAPQPPKPKPQPPKDNRDPKYLGLSIDTVARQVINGEWYDGQKRRDSLTRYGYNPDVVQARVNEILYGKPAPKPAPAKPKVGDMVKVKRGARDYNGRGVTSAWYTTPKRLSQLKGNRAVLDVGNWETPFNINDLYKV